MSLALNNLRKLTMKLNKTSSKLYLIGADPI